MPEPAAAPARSEALQCEEFQYECLQLQESRMDRCIQGQEREHRECVARARRNQFLTDSDCDYNMRYAERNCDESQVCEQRYDTCFERAGGTVESTRVCVRNCEAAL